MSWLRSLLIAFVLTLGLTTPALAQQPIPPTHYSTDERGVDLTNGGYFPFVTEVVIGQPGAGGLVYGRSHIGTAWRDYLVGTINIEPGVFLGTYTVSVGPYSDAFYGRGDPSNPTFYPNIMNGSSLSWNSSADVYTYTSSTGVVALFSGALADRATPYTANGALVTSITSPDGEVLTYSYVTADLCANAACSSTTPAARLQSVTNTLGYQIKYDYNSESTVFAQRSRWMSVARVTGLNRGVDYCADTAPSCTYTETWPSISYPEDTDPLSSTTVDEMNRTTLYRNNAAGRITGIRLPGSASDNVTIAYGSDGMVDSVTSAGGTWTYDFTSAGSDMVAEVDGPNGQGLRTLSENGMVQSYYDVNNNLTVVLWWAPGQPWRIDYPTGDSVQYTYDGRGNVTEVRQIPASGSGLADIVTTATYAASCTNPVICNLPTQTTDARGQVTDYVWNATHGGLVSVTRPPLLTGTDRPQTRITYGQVYAWYRNSAGTIVQAPTPIWRPTATSACQSGTTPGCVGTVAEQVAAVTYGSTGVMNNLLPTITTARNGDASIVATTTMTYTHNGDVATVDGPLSGTADQTRFLYNANRELTGAIGPDPDGSGSLLHRAQRITRNALGLPTLIEAGTTTGYTDPNWAAFSPLQQTAVTYDTFGRPLTQRLQAGSTTYSLSQVSYDASGRPDCTAVRMNPSSFASPPTSACTAATAGSFGPDRISRATYDTMSRVASVTSGYGVTGAITNSLTYSVGSQVQSMTDGEGNVTTWTYDGFQRPRRMYFPNASGTGTSTTDYEELTYDAYGQVTSTRARDGQVTSFSYNGIGLASAINFPGSELDQQFGYNLFGQPTSLVTVGTGGQTLTRAYDALGRMTGETGPLGTVAYQWDAAGRNTRITWPDAYYAQYAYDLTGAMMEVRENGATSGAGLLAVYGYDNLGRRTSVRRRGESLANASSTYGWDGASRLISLGVNLSGTSQDTTWTLDYSPAGQVVERSLSNTLYAYTAEPTLSDAYTNNGLNQVTAVDSTSVGYDGRGNITGDGTSTWNYDSANRIINGDYTGIDIGTYSYDPAGRMGRITAAGVDSRFIYAGAQAIGEYNASGGLIQRYVPGAGLDDYAAYTSGTGGSITRSWPIPDPLGSVTAQINPSNVATQINRYDEYGVPQAGFSGRFGYAGAMYLNRAMAAPWNMRNRQYNPSLGRFMQTDPIGVAGGVNLYAYVGGDPVNAVDPWGLQDCETDPDCPGDIDAPGRRNLPCPPFCNQYYDGLPWYQDVWFSANEWTDWAEITLADVILTYCTPRPQTGTERAIEFVGGLGDAVVVGGALSGQPEIAFVGGVLSFAAGGAQAIYDFNQRDGRGLAGDAAGFVVGQLPLVRQAGRGSALFDAGRDAFGRFLPGAALRREGVEAGSASLQGAAGHAAGSTAAASACQ
ncbi:MAG: RHS repeat-associated core domain-containing protein [Caulobacterales bacterium]|nr:RHS repeat-associated core domain-containing protein [Caulobacterales bacterium]